MNQTVISRSRQTKKKASSKLARTLHVYTSMVMLLIMLFFTLTGITLNHRDWFSSSEGPQQLTLHLPDELGIESKWMLTPIEQGNQVRVWLRNHYAVYGNQVSFEWEEDERLMVIDVKRPGGYSIAEVDLEAQEILLEIQNYGAVATLNDLHMGRYSGSLWSLFIDLSALAMLLFSLTGLWLVMPQKKKRNKLLSMSLLGTAIMTSAYIWVILG